MAGLVVAGVLATTGTAMADPFTIGAESNSFGHVLKSGNAECMWNHIHIAKPANQNEARFRPYIYSRFTMDFARRVWVAPGDMVTQECAETNYKAPPNTMHVAQHLAIWVAWAGTWVWCNNGPELSNGNWQHEMFTECGGGPTPAKTSRPTPKMALPCGSSTWGTTERT